MSSFNYIQDLLIENSKLRTENTSLLTENSKIRSVLEDILLAVNEIKSELKNAKPVTIVSSGNSQVNTDLPTQTKDFSNQKNRSMFIPTPDPDSLKDGISKEIRKRKRKIDFDNAVDKLADINPK